MLFLLLSVALRDLENLRNYPLSAYFFTVFQAQRNKLHVKSVDPQYGYISSSSQGAENPSVCELWPPRPPFKLPYNEQLALAAPQVGANSTRRCPRMRNRKRIYLKRQRPVRASSECTLQHLRGFIKRFAIFLRNVSKLNFLFLWKFFFKYM